MNVIRYVPEDRGIGHVEIKVKTAIETYIMINLAFAHGSHALNIIYYPALRGFKVIYNPLLLFLLSKNVYLTNKIYSYLVSVLCTPSYTSHI